MAAEGRKRSGRIFIILAIVLIVILAAAVFLLRDVFFPQLGAAGQPVSPTPSRDMVKIVILAQPVSRGTALTEEMLALVSYPQSELVEGLFFTDTKAVIGQKVKYDLEQGIPLTPNLLTSGLAGSYAADQIEPGMVAVSIPISRLTSVAYALQPGDHVNIIASLLLIDIDTNFQTRLPNLTGSIVAPGVAAEGGPATSTMTITVPASPSSQGRTELDPTLNSPVYVLPSEAQRPRLVSQTLVQDAVVLWVGDFPPDGKIGESQQPTPAAGEEGAAPPKPDIITLKVSAQDAVTLNYLMLANAKLNLALRGSGDDQRLPTESVTLQFIMDQYNIPYPVKLPYGVEPRVDELEYPPLLNEGQ